MQRVQALEPNDYAPGIVFAQRYLGKCATVPLSPAKALFSDEASFRREEIFNTDNGRMWAKENDIVYHRLDFRSIFGPVL